MKKVLNPILICSKEQANKKKKSIELETNKKVFKTPKVKNLILLSYEA